MFGIEYIPAIIKSCFNIAFSIITAIPYWHVVGIFLVCAYLGEQINKLIPNLISVNQTNN